ncbi:MAG: FAD binding domain-containing protein [Thermodesulfobacteriota bacterium]
MKRFIHFNARSVEQAVSLLNRFQGRAEFIAGGTDLLGKMKDRILPRYPEAVINLKTIPGLDFIRSEAEGGVTIGALTRLEDIAAHPLIKEKFTALAQAAGRTASPHIREMGTLAGNLCQDIRCWYYRTPENRFPCLRKGGGRCYAIEGDNRYHSIFGGTVEEGCYAVHPSDTAPALTALQARIRTSKRVIAIDDFFEIGVTKTTALDFDEIVLEIFLPEPGEGCRSAFLKFALRKSIDFPIVNCAVAVTLKGWRIVQARICLNAVHVRPYRSIEAEEALLGKPLTDETAEMAGNLAVAGARPLKHNAYMVQISRAMVKRTLLSCTS